jgi:hypothetical protein
MTISELRYLVALANRAHFGRAAEDCHVSQPTLSTQIRKLEEYHGGAGTLFALSGGVFTPIDLAMAADYKQGVAKHPSALALNDTALA